MHSPPESWFAAAEKRSSSEPFRLFIMIFETHYDDHSVTPNTIAIVRWIDENVINHQRHAITASDIMVKIERWNRQFNHLNYRGNLLLELIPVMLMSMCSRVSISAIITPTGLINTSLPSPIITLSTYPVTLYHILNHQLRSGCHTVFSVLRVTADWVNRVQMQIRQRHGLRMDPLSPSIPHIPIPQLTRTTT